MIMIWYNETPKQYLKKRIEMLETIHASTFVRIRQCQSETYGHKIKDVEKHKAEQKYFEKQIKKYKDALNAL